MTVDWLAVGAIATGCAAAATALAAAFTAWQAREVRRTVNEAQRDRQLLYQPYLVVEDISVEEEEGSIQNIGRGVAANCMVFRWYPSGDRETGGDAAVPTAGQTVSAPPGGYQSGSYVLALGAGQTKQWSPWLIRTERIDHIFAPESPQGERILVAICEDDIHRLHRFGSSGRHDLWSEADNTKPAWTNYLKYRPDGPPST